MMKPKKNKVKAGAKAVAKAGAGAALKSAIKRGINRGSKNSVYTVDPNSGRRVKDTSVKGEPVKKRSLADEVKVYKRKGVKNGSTKLSRDVKAYKERSALLRDKPEPKRRYQ